MYGLSPSFESMDRLRNQLMPPPGYGYMTPPGYPPPGYMMPPGYGQPQGILGNTQQLVRLVPIIATLWGAFTGLPTAPSAAQLTAMTTTEQVQSQVLYLQALAQHAKRDEQIRAGAFVITYLLQGGGI